MPKKYRSIKLQLGGLYPDVENAALHAGQTPADWIRAAILEVLEDAGDSLTAKEVDDDPRNS